MKLLTIILIILATLVIAEDQARVRIGKKFVDNLVDLFIPQVIEQINGLKSFEYNIDLTLLQLNIRNLNFDELRYNSSQYLVNFNKNSSSIDVEINSFKINLNSIIYHKFLFLSNSSGNLNANMNINFKISLALISDKNGVIQLKLNDYNFNYKGSSISFKGGFFEWNMNLLLNVFTM
jgi:hypothetical protein